MPRATSITNMNMGTHHMMPAAPRISTKRMPHHAQCGSVGEEDGQDEVDRGHQRPQQEEQDHEDPGQDVDDGSGHVPVRGVAQVEEHGRTAVDHALEPALGQGLRASPHGGDGFRAVGTDVEDHLQAGSGAVRGDVGVAEGFEPLVALQVELGEEDGLGTGGEGSLEFFQAFREERRVA